MKTLVTVVLTACLCLPAAASRRQVRPRPHEARAQRAHRRPRPLQPITVSAHIDEISLSPSLMRRLQANLVEGGYLSGTNDGRLGPRTRRALRDFQREYHLSVSGLLDRATAEALLGRDEISSFLVAHK
jgi:hypothetical protein